MKVKEEWLMVKEQHLTMRETEKSLALELAVVTMDGGPSRQLAEATMGSGGLPATHGRGVSRKK